MQFKEISIPYTEEFKKLQEFGFQTRPKKILKLLIKTKGNFEVVKAFLEAKDRLKEASLKRRFSQLEISTSETKEPMIIENSVAITVDSVSSNPIMNEKQYQKFLHKKEKMEKKLLKKEKRSLKKEEKKWKQDKPKYEKKSRNARSGASDSAVVNSISLSQAWPGVEHLYLDGNNMLFVTGPIRSLVLSRCGAKAEESLSLIARSFSQVMGVKCTLIYDSTKREMKEENYSVCSAQPSFGSSDDALVSWQEKSISSGGCNLYVTSDVALGERLRKAGGVVYKPKEWFFLAAEMLGGNVHSSEELDLWIAEFIKPLFN